MKTPTRCVVVVVLAILCGPALATVVDYSFGLDPDDFGNLRQKDLKACGLDSIGCGPSAAVNSFVFLQNTYPKIYDKKLVGEKGKMDQDNDGDMDDYDAMIETATELAKDEYMKTCCNKTTLRDDFFYGKRKYIEDHSPGDTIYEVMDDPMLDTLDPGGKFENQNDPEIKRQAPTPQWFSDNLKSGEDIEILITRDDGTKLIFGHYATVYALMWIDKDMDGMIGAADGEASISFIDPAFTDSNSGNEQITVPLFQRADKRLFFKSTAGKEYDIRMSVKESPKKKVPAPPTVMLLAAGLIGFLPRRLKARSVNSNE